MKKPLIMSVVAIGVLGVATSAYAQDSTPPPAETAPPPPAHHSNGGGDSISLGGGAGIGVGAAVTLSGLGAFGPAGQFVYDASIFHVEAMFGFASAEVAGGDRATEYAFGVGGWYHLHRGASSDFSVGALIGIDTTSGPGPSTTITAFEPGAQVRAFVTPNVAAFGRVGLAFLFGDTGSGTNVGLGGQPAGAFGFTYFFR